MAFTIEHSTTVVDNVDVVNAAKWNADHTISGQLGSVNLDLSALAQNVVIVKASPTLVLKANTESDSTIQFWDNSVQIINMGWSHAGGYFFIYDVVNLDTIMAFYPSTLTVNLYGACAITGDLWVGGSDVITSGQVLQNVTADAGIITSGTFGNDHLDLSAINQDIVFASQHYFKVILDFACNVNATGYVAIWGSNAWDSAGFMAVGGTDQSFAFKVAWAGALKWYIDTDGNVIGYGNATYTGTGSFLSGKATFTSTTEGAQLLLVGTNADTDVNIQNYNGLLRFIDDSWSYVNFSIAQDGTCAIRGDLNLTGALYVKLGILTSSEASRFDITTNAVGSGITIYKNDYSGREGDMDFVYGAGTSGTRLIKFIAFNGTDTWTTTIHINYSGDLKLITGDLYVDTVVEYTADTGVTIEGTLLKDYQVNSRDLFLTRSGGQPLIVMQGGVGAGWGRILIEDNTAENWYELSVVINVSVYDFVIQYNGTTKWSMQLDGTTIFTNNIKLKSDTKVLSFGADDDVTLTHVADSGLTLNSSMKLYFRDSLIYIGSLNDGYLDLEADTAIRFNANINSASVVATWTWVAAWGSYTGGHEAILIDRANATNDAEFIRFKTSVSLGFMFGRKPASDSLYFTTWDGVTTYVDVMVLTTGGSLTINGNFTFNGSTMDQITFIVSGYDTVYWMYKPSSDYMFALYDFTAGQFKFAIDMSGNIDTLGTISAVHCVGSTLYVGSGTNGLRLGSTADDNFFLTTYTNTANPNWTLGYGNGSGGLDNTKEFITSNAGVISFGNAYIKMSAVDDPYIEFYNQHTSNMVRCKYWNSGVWGISNIGDTDVKFYVAPNTGNLTCGTISSGAVTSSGVVQGTGWINSDPQHYDVTASRAFGTYYQNSRGKAIVVYWIPALGSSEYCEIYISSVGSGGNKIGNYIYASDSLIVFVVPKNYYYCVTRSASGTITSVWEQTL